MFTLFGAALPRASSLSRATSIHQTQLRRYSQQYQQQPSPTAAFYKTFTRPVAKCALLAVLVYQLVYFGWTKLEVEELKQEREEGGVFDHGVAEIIKLEAQVRSLQAAQAAAEAAKAVGAAPSASDSAGNISDGHGDDTKERGKAKGGWRSWK
ncbi:hypothetical protein C8A03DRAFT_30611 [Achaetomium macrosporum]|uniref:Uncharacterized protein n=1 Tax=Achaetomium macrosporum TaxID=79813 RepID=A0AAN7CFR8_9PEZI|nr:hypothetical protein C8A03DRAFT_30611 [Achaetomium macrosporum]